MRVRKKTVAGIGLTPLFMLWVSVCSADIPRWLSVMPLHEHAADVSVRFILLNSPIVQDATGAVKRWFRCWRRMGKGAMRRPGRL